MLTFQIGLHIDDLFILESTVNDEAADTRSESVNERPSGKCMYIYNFALSSILLLNSYLVVILQRKYRI